VVVVEQAAKTDRWISGNLAQSDPQSARTWAPWAGQGCTWILSYLDGGQDWSPTGLGPCNINCNNSQGVYSFHSGGANALFLDGSVQFLKEGIAAELLYAYVSRSRGELIGEDF
jgi:prepilin-type processing-associated H-X9-DG protein